MAGLQFEATRRDGFARMGQLRRVVRRFIDGGGALECCELNSCTWFSRHAVPRLRLLTRGAASLQMGVSGRSCANGAPLDCTQNIACALPSPMQIFTDSR